jgi:hypothetical protein
MDQQFFCEFHTSTHRESPQISIKTVRHARFFSQSFSTMRFLALIAAFAAFYQTATAAEINSSRIPIFTHFSPMPILDNPHSGIKKQFYISKQPKTWLVARGVCHKHDLKLAQLETIEQLNFVIDECKKSSVCENIEVIFIGMERRGNDDDWFWYDKNTSVAYEIPWAICEPNNLDGIEDCVGVRIKTSFRLNDYPKTIFVGYFLCEQVIQGEEKPVQAAKTKLYYPFGSFRKHHVLLICKLKILQLFLFRLTAAEHHKAFFHV